MLSHKNIADLKNEINSYLVKYFPNNVSGGVEQSLSLFSLISNHSVQLLNGSGWKYSQLFQTFVYTYSCPSLWNMLPFLERTQLSEATRLERFIEQLDHKILTGINFQNGLHNTGFRYELTAQIFIDFFDLLERRESDLRHVYFQQFEDARKVGLKEFQVCLDLWKDFILSNLEDLPLEELNNRDFFNLMFLDFQLKYPEKIQALAEKTKRNFQSVVEHLSVIFLKYLEHDERLRQFETKHEASFFELHGAYMRLIGRQPQPVVDRGVGTEFKWTYEEQETFAEWSNHFYLGLDKKLNEHGVVRGEPRYQTLIRVLKTFKDSEIGQLSKTLFDDKKSSFDEFMNFNVKMYMLFKVSPDDWEKFLKIWGLSQSTLEKIKSQYILEVRV